jgi:hypothetical protein
MKKTLPYLLCAIYAICGASVFAQGAATVGASLSVINRFNYLTNLSGAVATNTTATVIASPGVVSSTTPAQLIFPVFRGRGMSFVGSIQNGSGANATVTYKIDLTPDGTNWTTTAPIQFTGTCAGTNVVIFSTNLLSDQFDNERYGKISSLTGGTGGNYVTNNWLIWSAIP